MEPRIALCFGTEIADVANIPQIPETPPHQVRALRFQCGHLFRPVKRSFRLCI
ncbi:hypothetical protein BJV78DRAFT_1256473 [Lactifluus subvellereus]|nr:hypothetical protein BJV78DRAFT_1256473 [Lactifluus subvellereus]